jgi:hypothetical protein
MRWLRMYHNHQVSGDWAEDILTGFDDFGQFLLV